MARERTKFEKVLEKAKRTSDRLHQFGVDRPVLPTIAEYDNMSKGQKISTIRTLQEYVKSAPSNFALRSSQKHDTWQSQERAAKSSVKVSRLTKRVTYDWDDAVNVNAFSEMLRRITRKIATEIVSGGFGVQTAYVLKIRGKIEEIVGDYGAHFANLLAEYILDDWSTVDNFDWEYDSKDTGESLGVSEFLSLIEMYIKEVKKEYKKRS